MIFNRHQLASADKSSVSTMSEVAYFPPQLCFCEECCYCQLLVALEAHIYGELVHFKSYQRFLAFTFRNRLPNSPISSSLFSPAQQSTLWGCHPTIKDLNHGNHNSSKMSYYYGGVRKVTWSAHEVTVALQCLHG